MSRYECRVGTIDADITTFRILGRMSWIATKLYNTALWHAKETWKSTGKIPTGYDLQKVVLESYYHSYLPIKQIEIVPRKGCFELHAKILLPEPIWKTEGQVVAIDLGQKNPIVSRDEHGNVDIFKGGEILSDLRYWNKEKSRVRSQVMGRTKGKKKHSKPLRKMAKKGASQVKHAVNAMTSTFVELCQERNVKEVIVGDLKGIKKEKDGTGKRWNDKANQNWLQNADVNGAGNQLARYLRVETIHSSSGCLAQPTVYRWDGHFWSGVDEG